MDSFALGLVALAVLLVAGAFGWADFETIRLVTFGVLGLAPVAFLAGLLNAHLSRPAMADLLVQLRSDPEPSDLRHALAGATRDPSLALVYWLPDFGRWVDVDGVPVDLPPRDSGRATTLIDREGTSGAALIHDRSLADEPQLLDAVSAAAAIGLENGRLHAELRARLDELRGSRRLRASQQMPYRLSIEQHLRRFDRKIKCDPAIPRHKRQLSAILQIRLSFERLQPYRPVHRAGIQEIKSKTFRDAARHRRFPSSRRPVDRDDHVRPDYTG